MSPSFAIVVFLVCWPLLASQAASEVSRAADDGHCLLQTDATMKAKRVSLQELLPEVPNLLATGSGASSKLETWQHALKADPHLFDGCRRIFFDVGSNRGTHVRKLFEPQKYPGCPYLSVFDKGFGAPEARSKPFSESGICAFGFEANPRWAPTLQEVERAYNAKGWKVKFFAPEAVSNSTGTLPFYKNDAGSNSDWGFSMRRTVANSEEVLVPEIDLSAFIETMHKAAPAGFRLMKMDIESAEFVVLPPFLTKQLLCKNVLDTITIEWHKRFLKSAASKKHAAELERKVNSPDKCASGVATTIIKFDDESYLDDGMPLPSKADDESFDVEKHEEFASAAETSLAYPDFVPVGGMGT